MNKGTLSAIAAYVWWGFFPVYFKLLQAVPAFQITAHRVVWSCLFLFLLVGLRRELPALFAATNRRTFLIYLLSGSLLAINWGTYVWAVNSGYVVESSLGYFINPLVSVLLGVVFLKERLRPLQWVPVGLAAAGVTYLTIAHGRLPWIALVLAFSFGSYGLVKKIAPLGSLQGTTMETAAIFIPALGFLIFEEAQGVGGFVHTGLLPTLLLVLSGVVTAIPLLLFATGARNVPLSTMGLLQYVTPTLQFLFGVFLFGEAFTHDRVIGFSIIWIALILFSIESFITRSQRESVVSEPTSAD